jgi:hypothetical protein
MSKDGQTTSSENHSEETVKFGDQPLPGSHAWIKPTDTRAARKNRGSNQGTENLG